MDAIVIAVRRVLGVGGCATGRGKQGKVGCASALARQPPPLGYNAAHDYIQRPCMLGGAWVTGEVRRERGLRAPYGVENARELL